MRNCKPLNSSFIKLLDTTHKMTVNTAMIKGLTYACVWIADIVSNELVSPQCRGSTHAPNRLLTENYYRIKEGARTYFWEGWEEWVFFQIRMLSMWYWMLLIPVCTERSQITVMLYGLGTFLRIAPIFSFGESSPCIWILSNRKQTLKPHIGCTGAYHSGL